jgi:uncharacterized repeat protein (TIGR02543 family)
MMKRKLRFSGIFLCIALLAGLCVVMIGNYGGTARADTADTYFFVARNGFADPITKTDEGFVRVNFLNYEAGLRCNKPIDVTRPFRIGFYQDTAVGPHWIAMGVSVDTSDVNTSMTNGIAALATDPNVVPGAVMRWLGLDYSAMFFHGGMVRKGLDTVGTTTDVNTEYWNREQGLTNGDETYNTREAGARYDYYFDIQDTAGNETEQTGSKLILTIKYAGGTVKQATFWIAVTRDSFPNNNGYFWFNSGNQKGVHYFKVTQEYTVARDNLGKITDFKALNFDGTQSPADIGAAGAKVYAGDRISFKVTGGEDYNVKIGGSVIMPDESGVYEWTMPFENTAIILEDSSGNAYYPVSFNSRGGSTVTTQAIASGGTANRPADPTQAGYFFAGWFTEDACENEFDFTTPITGAKTLYAKWNEKIVLTYKVKHLSDTQREIVLGGKAQKYTFAEIYGKDDPQPKYNVDSLRIVWYGDAEMTEAFNFDTEITADTNIYGRIEETKQYKQANAYGWDEPDSLRDDSGLEFLSSAAYMYPIDMSENGSATYSLTRPTATAVYSRGLDVSKPFYINLDIIDATAGGNWFVMGLYDRLTLAQLSYTGSYIPGGGAVVGLGFNSKTGAVLGGALTNWNIADVYALAGGDASVHMAVYIAENAGDSVIKIGDTVVSSLHVSRADFDGGYAYFTFGTFYQCMVDALVYQDMDITADDHAHAAVSAEQNAAAVFITVDAYDGYELNGIFVDGKAVRYEEYGDGYILFIEQYGDIAVTLDMRQIADDGGSSSAKPSETPEDVSGCEGCGGVAVTGSAAGLTGALLVLCLLFRRKAGI